ncbi:MAG TPA: hypothetical protein DEB39_13580 [Planctomycetaceae bacterium]|nr:hypothetical protein [Planctomycetaceae bacterium]
MFFCFFTEHERIILRSNERIVVFGFPCFWQLARNGENGDMLKTRWKRTFGHVFLPRILAHNFC